MIRKENILLLKNKLEEHNVGDFSQKFRGRGRYVCARAHAGSVWRMMEEKDQNLQGIPVSQDFTSFKNS